MERSAIFIKPRYPFSSRGNFAILMAIAALIPAMFGVLSIWFLNDHGQAVHRAGYMMSAVAGTFIFGRRIIGYETLFMVLAHAGARLWVLHPMQSGLPVRLKVLWIVGASLAAVIGYCLGRYLALPSRRIE